MAHPYFEKVREEEKANGIEPPQAPVPSSSSSSLSSSLANSVDPMNHETDFKEAMDPKPPGS